jgi:hypothetical protein
MKKFYIIILLFCSLFTSTNVKAYNTIWSVINNVDVPSSGTRQITPEVFTAFMVNDQALRAQLFSLKEGPENAQLVELPAPDGGFRTFRVWQSSMMEPALAEKYPGIKTFTGVDLNRPAVSIKLDYNEFGFHGMVYDGVETYSIDPYSNVNDGFYISYYKKDYSRPIGTIMTCLVNDELRELGAPSFLTGSGLPPVKLKTNGLTKRNYRLALACTGEYAVAVAGVSPTKAAVLSKMVTSMNRVNGVYEREFAVHMTLIANEDTLIFLNGSADPYSNSSGGTMLGQNQTTVNSRVGSSNYDIGHVFSTGGGGIATLGGVCGPYKAQGVTGSPNPVGDFFDIDYVAHEMGHQFGADHSFNANSGSCSGNGASSQAYEPGSGSTIMAYAGICGGGDNIQAHSDAYFHAISLIKISNVLAGSGNCASTSVSGNTPPVIPTFTQILNIPKLTPFELTSPTAIDIDHDTLTYCWEQWNLGDFGASWVNTRLKGPIFRSFNPDSSRTRVFPAKAKLALGVTSYLGEKLPDTTRFLTFKLTVRDIYNGIGTFNISDDTIHLNTTYSIGPFKVLTPATAVNFPGGSTQTITWDVANTTAAPINCSNVNIYFSADGGNTFPEVLALNTPNDGSETVVIPYVGTVKGRVKVKAVGNVFHSWNPSNFTVTINTAVNDVSWQSDVKVYPVPATEQLTISNDHKNGLNGTIVNAIGQRIWSGDIEKMRTIPVDSWAKGVYYLKLADKVNGETITKSIVIQ